MKSGSWKAPFSFIGRIIMYLPKKLGNSIIDPTERGKVRWAMLGIIVLVWYGATIVYPQGYNQVVDQVNTWVESTGYRLDHVDEKEFNLGLDLQGGAHLVYQADLAEVETADQAEALARLRDRIERRVNGLGVSEPIIQVAGEDRLVVELAGANVEEAIDQIGATPLLEFREKNTDPPRSLSPEEQQELTAFNEDQHRKASDAYIRVTSGVESFEDVAKEVSEDEATKASGGDFGPITRTSHPQLSEGVENTLIGKVVEGILDASDGFYIVRVDDRQETDEELLLSHILICYDGATSCENGASRDEALASIQAIAQDISPANFEDKAAEFSTDPTVSENRGDLDWVGPGVVIGAFEDAAKALEIGQISEPVETEFGFHLIWKRDVRPLFQIQGRLIARLLMVEVHLWQDHRLDPKLFVVLFSMSIVEAT